MTSYACVQLVLLYGYLYSIMFTFVEIVVFFCICAGCTDILRENHRDDLQKRLCSGLCKALQRTVADGESQQQECVICMEHFASGEKLVTLPCHAGHQFHEGCIMVWFKRSDKCPMCNAPVTREGLARQALLEVRVDAGKTGDL